MMTVPQTPQTPFVYRRRSVGFMTFTVLLAAALLAVQSLGAASGAADAQTGSAKGLEVEPFLFAEKSVFAEGERVFFWLGVRKIKQDEKLASIPRKFWHTCRLTIVRPDGTKKTHPVSWPIDGPSGSTWQGGDGLREAAVPGRYTLVFEFAGKKSAPASILVEGSPVTGTAVGRDTAAPWNPKFTPAISRAEALRLARKHLGAEARQWNVASVHVVRMSDDHASGEWRVYFRDKQRRNSKEVVVAFHQGKPNAGVRVSTGPMQR